MGSLADRVGRRATIAAGWLICAVVYAGFAMATSATALAALFVVYGAYHAFTEGAEKALVADLAPANARGTAFGWYHLVSGIIAVPAGALFGGLWDAYGPSFAFGWGLAVALAAAIALIALRPEPR
jgi:MFS family permease